MRHIVAVLAGSLCKSITALTLERADKRVKSESGKVTDFECKYVRLGSLQGRLAQISSLDARVATMPTLPLAVSAKYNTPAAARVRIEPEISIPPAH